MAHWYLRGYTGSDAALRHIQLDEFPVLVGRQAGLALADASANMSRYHAELVERDGRLIVRDLGSKNGTFVNRERIQHEAMLGAGDIVHFADAEFLVGTMSSSEEAAAEDTATNVITDEELPAHFTPDEQAIHRLIDTEAITAVYQPIVSLATGEQVGQECLSRGAASDLPSAPDHLLRLAESTRRAVELSELMRRRSIEGAGAAGLHGPTFVNIHPSEVTSTERLVAQLWSLRKAWPELELALELHESAVTNPDAIGKLHRELRLIGIALAYDDFGAGQARLAELAAVPPRYLKFDHSMIRDLHAATHQRRRMVEMLLRFAHETGIVTLAEGIASAEEARACTDAGFDWAQGYYFGAPAALP